MFHACWYLLRAAAGCRLLLKAVGVLGSLDCGGTVVDVEAVLLEVTSLALPRHHLRGTGQIITKRFLPLHLLLITVTLGASWSVLSVFQTVFDLRYKKFFFKKRILVIIGILGDSQARFSRSIQVRPLFHPSLPTGPCTSHRHLFSAHGRLRTPEPGRLLPSPWPVRRPDCRAVSLLRESTTRR